MSTLKNQSMVNQFSKKLKRSKGPLLREAESLRCSKVFQKMALMKLCMILVFRNKITI